MEDYRPKILIIDDDKFQHELLEAILAPAGYDLIHAADGIRGVKLVKKNPPDMVVLDVQMPVMDGFKTLKAIREIPSCKDIPVMLLTALDRDRLKIAALELGADDYVTKPFNKAELLARVKSILRRSERTQKKSGEMVGDLETINLGDLMQSMELGLKTAVISIDALEGEIFVEEGMVADARLRRFSGEEAFTRIMLCERGGFRAMFKDLPDSIPRRGIPITSLLMKAAAEVDDIKSMGDSGEHENPIVSVAGDLSGFPPIAEQQRIFPVPLLELIALMEGSLNKNRRLVGLALRKGVLKATPPPGA